MSLYRKASSGAFRSFPFYVLAQGKEVYFKLGHATSTGANITSFHRALNKVDLVCRSVCTDGTSRDWNKRLEQPAPDFLLSEQVTSPAQATNFGGAAVDWCRADDFTALIFFFFFESDELTSVRTARVQVSLGHDSFQRVISNRTRSPCAFRRAQLEPFFDHRLRICVPPPPKFPWKDGTVLTVQFKGAWSSLRPCARYREGSN